MLTTANSWSLTKKLVFWGLIAALGAFIWGLSITLHPTDEFNDYLKYKNESELSELHPLFYFESADVRALNGFSRIVDISTGESVLETSLVENHPKGSQLYRVYNTRSPKPVFILFVIAKTGGRIVRCCKLES
jgi:hypothetical protein